ncbi:hypothetical protein FS837_002029 [Tulasnella sp. UAMH 9824]|nr:hypothetical protein FS837_002029 [Tulasnella sp. UAMH 9824]
MQGPKDFDPLPPRPPPARRSTSATLFQSSATEMPSEIERRRAEDERLGFYAIPFKALVDSLSLPSSIGTAIAAGATYTVLSLNSLLGDSSPEALAEQRRMVKLLAWATILFAVATVTTVCLQALYASASFCQIISDKLHYKVELRTKFEPWPSWDFMRYIMAYSVFAAAFVAIGMHLVASFLVIESLKAYVPALVSQIIIGLIFVVTIVGWVVAIVLGVSRGGASANTEENVLAADTVGQKGNHAILPGGY